MTTFWCPASYSPTKILGIFFLFLPNWKMFSQHNIRLRGEYIRDINFISESHVMSTQKPHAKVFRFVGDWVSHQITLLMNCKTKGHDHHTLPQSYDWQYKGKGKTQGRPDSLSLTTPWGCNYNVPWDSLLGYVQLYFQPLKEKKNQESGSSWTFRTFLFSSLQ